MLTHKLADYYHMTHQVDAGLGGVRVFRTPFCRLPAPLTSISNPPTSGNTPPPAPPPAMKIMRRGGEGTGPSPSKATSETGSDGKDKGLSAKEKLVNMNKVVSSCTDKPAGYRSRKERSNMTRSENAFSARTTSQAKPHQVGCAVDGLSRRCTDIIL